MTIPTTQEAILRSTLHNSRLLLEDMRGQLAGFERAQNLGKVYEFRDGIAIVEKNIVQNQAELDAIGGSNG